jgi:hypothetical protein
VAEETTRPSCSPCRNLCETCVDAIVTRCEAVCFLWPLLYWTNCGVYATVPIDGAVPGIGGRRKGSWGGSSPHYRLYGSFLRPSGWALMARTPKQIASSRRRRLLEKLSKRDGNYCRICGGPLSGDDVVEVDHRVPLCRGGANVEANLQLAHRSCNRAKAGRRQVSIHVILDDLWARLDAQQETINALMACIEDYIVMRDRT